MKKLVYLLFFILGATTIFAQKTLKVENSFKLKSSVLSSPHYFGFKNDKIYLHGYGAGNLSKVACLNSRTGEVLWTKPILPNSLNNVQFNCWMANEKIYCLGSYCDSKKDVVFGLLNVYDLDMNPLETHDLGEDPAVGYSVWSYQIQSDGRTLVSLQRPSKEIGVNETMFYHKNEKNFSSPSSQRILIIGLDGKIDEIRNIELDPHKTSVFLRIFMVKDYLYVLNYSFNKKMEYQYQLIYQTKDLVQKEITLDDPNTVGIDLAQGDDGKIYLLTNSANSEINRTFNISAIDKGTIRWTSHCSVDHPALKTLSLTNDYSTSHHIQISRLQTLGNRLVLGGYFRYIYSSTVPYTMMPFEINIDQNHELSVKLINSLVQSPVSFELDPPALFVSTGSGLAMITTEADLVPCLKQYKRKNKHKILLISDGMQFTKSIVDTPLVGVKTEFLPFHMRECQENKFIEITGYKNKHNLIVYSIE